MSVAQSNCFIEAFFLVERMLLSPEHVSIQTNTILFFY